MLPPTTNIKEAYANGQDSEQDFIQNLSLFLSTFLKEHGSLVEKKTEFSDKLLAVSKSKKKFNIPVLNVFFIFCFAVLALALLLGLVLALALISRFWL